jgi:hypothetical protein
MPLVFVTPATLEYPIVPTLFAFLCFCVSEDSLRSQTFV